LSLHNRRPQLGKEYLFTGTLARRFEFSTRDYLNPQKKTRTLIPDFLFDAFFSFYREMQGIFISIRKTAHRACRNAGFPPISPPWIEPGIRQQLMDNPSGSALGPFFMRRLWLIT
jgi:hypothetical protein